MMKATLAAAFLAATAAWASGAELLRLEVKDSETPGWSSSKAVPTVSQVGESFVRLESKDPVKDSPRLGASAPVEAGKSYELKFDCKSDVEGSGMHMGSWVCVVWSGKDKKSVKLDGVIIPPAPNWTSKSALLTAPEGAVSVSLEFRIQNRKGVVDIKNVSLSETSKAEEKSAAANPFEDMQLVEKYELKKQDGSFVLSGSAGDVLKPLKGETKLPFSFVLPDKHCENPELVYAIDASFVPAFDSRNENAHSALFTLGRNMTGIPEGDSFTMIIWGGKNFFNRITSETKGSVVQITKPEADLKKGRVYEGKALLGASSVEAFLGDENLGSNKMPNDKFLWPKGKPFFIGGESGHESIFKGEIKAFSISVMKPSFSVSLDGGWQASYLKGAGPHELKLKLEGECKDQLRVKVLDMFDKELVKNVETVRSANSLTVKLPRLPYGCCSLIVEKASAGAIKLSTSFAIMPESVERVPAKDSPFGMTQGINLKKGETNPVFVDTLFKLSADAGVRWWRVWASWNDLEPVEGQPFWDGLDMVVSSAKKNGVEPYICLTGGYQPWQTAIKPPYHINDGHFPPMDKWRKHVRDVAERYKGKVNFYMIGNESDTKCDFFPFTPEAYFEFLKASYEVLKDVDPSIEVGLGGFCAAYGMLDKTSHDEKDNAWGAPEFYKLKPQAYYNIVDFHGYSDDSNGLSWERNFQQMKKVKKFLAENGDGAKPVWNSETDFCSSKVAKNGSGFGNHTTTHSIQSDRLTQWYAQSLCLGIERNYWYILAGEVPGLTNSDFTPKPAYPAHAALANFLKNARFMEELELGENIRAYRFSSLGGEKIVAWTIIGKEPVSIASDDSGSFLSGLFGSKAKLSVQDVYGNEELSASSGKPASFALDESPRWIVADNGRIELARLVEISMKDPFQIKGRRSALCAVLRNPSDKDCDVEIKMADEGGVAGVKVVVPAGKTVESQFPVSLGDSGEIEYSVDYKGGISYFLLNSLKVQPKISVDLTKGDAETTLGDESRLAKGGAIRDNQNRVMRECEWKGVSDLSAKMTASQEGRKLALRFDVTDDKVVPAPEGRGLYEFDAVELFLDFHPSDRSPGKKFCQVVVSPDGRVLDCKKNLPADFKATAVKTAEGYSITTSFTLPPDAEPIIGLDFALDDTDDNAPRKVQMFWAGDGDDCSSAARYGLAILKKEGKASK